MDDRTDWMKPVSHHCNQLTRSNRDASRLLSNLHQPLTSVQVARRELVNLDRASYLFWILGSRRLLECLNPDAHKSRLYWLTGLGLRCQAWQRSNDGLPRLVHDFPAVDWDLYGWLCHRHRTAIVKEIIEPLHPATIKRRARRRDETIRMSANNVRDVIKLLLERGIVELVESHREAHPRYRLTQTGQDLQKLLLSAENTGMNAGRPSP